MLVISHTPHYKKNGNVVGWGPTVREVDKLAKIFNQVVHLAPLHSEPPPASSLPYESSNVRLRFIPPTGGDRWVSKLGILFKLPAYIKVILEELAKCGMVHIRTPANISLIVLLILVFVRSPRMRWVKYAGNWSPDGSEPWSYTFQRWWLNKNLHRGLVTVNGSWPHQPSHVHSFYNPSLTEEEQLRAAPLVKDKKLSMPIRLIYVGRLEMEKGVGRALQIMSHLLRRGISAKLDLIGDGPERAQLEKMAESLGVSSLTTFHGWLPRTELDSYYVQVHFMVHPSTTSEGWPKVLSEAMAYGVVPIAGAISSIPQIISDVKTGVALPPHDIAAFAAAIENFIRHPQEWEIMVQAGLRSANLFTYKTYLKAITRVLKSAYTIEQELSFQSDK